MSESFEIWLVIIAGLLYIAATCLLLYFKIYLAALIVMAAGMLSFTAIYKLWNREGRKRQLPVDITL